MPLSQRHIRLAARFTRHHDAIAVASQGAGVLSRSAIPQRGLPDNDVLSLLYRRLHGVFRAYRLYTDDQQ
jgi:hypothetical protein